MSPASRIRLFVLIFILLTSSIALYSQSALQFMPVPPCRIVDTRQPPGQFGGPTIEANSSRDFPIPLSACNIPGTAAAYSLNVTAVPWGKLYYMTVWPTGQSQPVVSTLNSYDGRVKANAAIVPAGSAGSNGAVSVYVTNKSDVILDINGYFAPANTSTLAFFPLTPCRVADTRGTPGPLGGPILQANQQRAFPVLASTCNIPTAALAYSLNFTVLPAKTLGYLTVWPTGPGTQPVVSTLNATTGTIVANAALVPAGVSGAISTFVTDTTHLIIDIDGYFAPANSRADPLSLYPLVPCRVFDSRGNGPFVGTIPIDVLGSSCNVPSAEAYVFNATVVPLAAPWAISAYGPMLKDNLSSPR